jgi:hypothetical protein
MDVQTYVWTLSTQVPGQAVQQVRVLARDQGIGQTGLRIVGCSFTNNIAVMVRDTVAWTSEVWVVRLTDGAVMSHHAHSYDPNALVTVVGSRNGAYIAENGEATTTIRRVSDWSVAGQVEAPYQVLAFSGDASLALGVKRPYLGVGGSFALIDLRTGRRAWTFDAAIQSIYRWTASPGSAAFAIILRAPHWFNQMVIVQGDGTTRTVPGRLEPLF